MAEIAEDHSPDRTGASGRREWLIRGLLVVVSLVVALLSIEALLRLIDYRHRPFAVTGATHGNQPLTLALESESFVFDPFLLWKPRASHGVFNPRGLRGEIPTDDDHRFRIVVIGDSNTLGWITGSEASWPGFLDERLPDDRIVLINASSWGWSSFQGVRRILDTADLAPDLVIFGFGANDGHQRGVSDREFAERLRRFDAWQGWRLRDLALTVLDQMDRRRQPRTRVAFDEFEANLRRAHELVTATGASLAFTTRAYRETSDSPRFWSYYVEGYNEITRRLAAELGVAVIDHGAWSAGRFELFTDSSHYTELAHRAAARIAHHAIRDQLPAHPDEDARRIVLARDPDRHGFHRNHSYPLWSDGDALFDPVGFEPLPGDRLAIDTYGWHPWRHDPQRLWVQVRADGRLLDPCSRTAKRLTFRLPPEADTIEVLRITSTTFVANEYFAGPDQRRLGLDIEQVGLISAAEAPCG